jgi:FkbM family methyltransferase
MIDLKEIKYIKLCENFQKLKNVFDIGGFNGEWSDFFLKKNDCTITIFEPGLENFLNLKKKYEKIESVSLINKGISDENTQLKYYNLKSTNNGVRQMSGFVFREIYKNYEYDIHLIDVIKLDSFTSQRIDFLKIDTEGFELNVLKGCEKLLSEKKIIFIQFEYGGTFKDKGIKLNDVISFLNNFEYRVYDITPDDKVYEVKDFSDNYNYNNFLSTFINL